MLRTPSSRTLMIAAAFLPAITLYGIVTHPTIVAGCAPAIMEVRDGSGGGGPVRNTLCGEPGIEMRVTLNTHRNRVETAVRSLGRGLHSLVWTPPRPVKTPFDPGTGRPVLQPAGRGDGYWIGAPATYHDDATGTLYLYTRSRGPGERGYRARIWRTRNGTSLEPIWTLEKETIGALSMERAALHRTAAGNYTLFLSYQDANTGRWEILRMTAASPSGFDPGEGRLLPHPRGRPHLKDPIVHGDTLYVHAPSRFFRSSTTLTATLNGSTPTFTGRLGFGREERFAPRLTSILSVNGTAVAFYDVRPTIIRTGEETARYGVLNGSMVRPLLPASTALISQAGTGALRYITTERVGNTTWFFYERAIKGGGHALAHTRQDTPDTAAALEHVDS